MTYRKIGGLHWLAFGRLRIAFCIVKRKRVTMPKVHLPNWGGLSELG
jgi:hypothetical protein